MLNDIPGPLVERILCSFDEPVVVFNDKFAVAWVNPSAEILFGHSFEFLKGKKCAQVFPGRLECLESCPVRRALEPEDTSEKPPVFSRCGLADVIPFEKGSNSFALAILKSLQGRVQLKTGGIR